jgi:c-di-GMP-binding flagellar brake protein YcgR
VATVVERSKVFEAGLPVTLEIGGPDDSFPTRIEEVRAGYLVVGTPMKQREYLDLPNGQKVMLAVSRRNNPYFFESVVTGTEWIEGQQMTLLRRPADNAGVALRQHVRVPVTISDAQFWWEQENGKFGPVSRGQLIDLSAGGMHVTSKEGLPQGKKVLARFTLSREFGHVMVDAMVLRDVERVSDVGVRSHRSQCQWVDLPEKEREKLIKFVFQRERELRQKGVL